jgi:anhydro-N-acetylmuramic acid kinase
MSADGAPEFYVGLMSGTSLDGIDAALVRFEGENLFLEASHYHPFPADLRERLNALILSLSIGWDALGQLDAELGELFAACVATLLERHPPRAQVKAIGSHGLTVRHQPSGVHPFSLQIGDPNRIAQLTGITTVADFRRRDIAAGGQGAPLVPAFHAALFRGAAENRAVLNLGGIANLTVLPADSSKPVTGFDTGPGNTLLDFWMQRHGGQAYDAGGAWAAQGQVIPSLLQRLLDEPYFSAPPPKSTGKELFNPSWLEGKIRDFAACDPADVQATLAELTAVSAVRAIRQYAPDTGRLLVCGGGAHNADMLRRLRVHLGGVVESTESFGIAPDWVEAMAFAWLARQTLRGLPGNLISVTGAKSPVVLGGIYPACGTP